MTFTVPNRVQPDFGIPPLLLGLSVLAVLGLSGALLKAQNEPEFIDDITGNYHFISVDDTLAILDEEGRLKGYIEVAQTEEESDTVLTFNIIEGNRKKSHVEFRTNKIHGKYYRFSGEVERGRGHQPGEPDYLHLIGNVEIVTVNAATGQESVQRVRVFLKSFGKSERSDD